MASVQIDRVGKSFGQHRILQDVSFEIPDGAFVVLVGPSGCGKSTLLRLIAGLEEIGSGHIGIGGKVVNELPPMERNIAMVFQNYALYPHMTVAKNMAFSLSLQKAPAAEIERKVKHAAAILGLENMLDRLPRQLSGGQRQRVAMGRAIVRDPQVFLFDEPLSNLDAKLRVQMRTEIKALHQRLNSTMVYVTHDQVEAMTMADLIVVMQGGRIEQIGAPLELYDKPANTFVAGFIGSPAMNFLSGQIQDGGFVTSSGVVLPLSVNAPRYAAEAIYGVRPEHMECGTDGLPFLIDVVEPLGSETQLHGRLGGDHLSILLRQRLTVEAGQTIHVRPIVEQVHLFDRATGGRISQGN